MISGEELTSYGSEYFGMLQLTFENPTDDWVRIEKLSSTVGEGTIFEVVFPAAESPGRTSTTGSPVDEGKVIHV